MENEKKGWSGQFAFILAAAASAVGLGNLWRFPYLAAKYGGGIFLFVYVILAFTLGIALLAVEVSIGRRTGHSPIKAFAAAIPKWSILGYLAMLVAFIILPYYCVIGGWLLKYLCHYTVLLFNPSQNALPDGAFFMSFISSNIQPLVFTVVFICITAFFIALGIRKGIEKLNIVLMPLLILLAAGIAVFVCTQPSTRQGVIQYIKPDFSKFSPATVVAAMGQVFYSLSLAMGIMITYGSYMRKNSSIERCAIRIQLFDTAVAFTAGLMIVPAFYVFSKSGIESGDIGLMFTTLPAVFAKMHLPGFLGGASLATSLGFAFFALALFAGLTSAISLFEAVLSNTIEVTGMPRKLATAVLAVITVLLAAPSALCYGSTPFALKIPFVDMPFLDFCDFLANNILMPILAFFTVILAGWILKPSFFYREIRKRDQPFHIPRVFAFIIKWVAPPFILTIFTVGVLNALKVISFAK